jgi:uncharacterized protein DUF1348
VAPGELILASAGRILSSLIIVASAIPACGTIIARFRATTNRACRVAVHAVEHRCAGRGFCRGLRGALCATALRAFFESRSARQQNYRLRKRLRTFLGDTLTKVWDGEWDDAQTGAKMKGFGVELWVMREGCRAGAGRVTRLRGHMIQWDAVNPEEWP